MCMPGGSFSFTVGSGGIVFRDNTCPGPRLGGVGPGGAGGCSKVETRNTARGPSDLASFPGNISISLKQFQRYHPLRDSLSEIMAGTLILDEGMDVYLYIHVLHTWL